MEIPCLLITHTSKKCIGCDKFFNYDRSDSEYVAYFGGLNGKYIQLTYCVV
jgi:hypothetical protein